MQKFVPCSKFLYQAITQSTSTPFRMPSLGRHLSTTSRLLNQYAFYNLVLAAPTPKRAVFHGNYVGDTLTSEERIAKVFGGRIKGETRQSSSRITRGPPQNIAGITVPAKPEEPDNCCMSGCINCVWELFNDDLKEWADLRNKAADRLVKVGGRWPEDFHPPTRKLKRENMPLSMANMKIDHRNLKLDHEEAWGNAPVSMRVFAEMEKKMKQRRAREGKLEA